MTRHRRNPSSRGFTAIEMLVVIAILGILLTTGIPLFTSIIQQTKMVGIINNTGSMFRYARSEAIKKNFQTVLRYDFNTRRVEVFADLHGTATTDPPDGIFNPVVGEPPTTTDYWLGSFGLPAGIEVEAPGTQDEIDGFTTVNNGGTNEQVAIFLPTGSIDVVGALRLADARGNYFEIRISPAATARIHVQKWDTTELEWFEKGEDGHAWEWL